MHWHRLLEVVGRNDLLDDPRFVDAKSRAANFRSVDEVISAWTIQHDKHSVMQLLGDAGIPASATFDTVELSQDPDLRERGTFVTVDHPVRGKFVLPGSMIKLSASHVPVKPAPLLGADNVEVYRDILGIPDDEIEKLQEEGAI
jgi:formyl-CoA transferase